MKATLAGVQLPVTDQPTKSNTLVSLRLPHSSLDWSGPEWVSPVGLEFKTELVEAQQIGVDYAVGFMDGRADWVLAELNTAFKHSAQRMAQVLTDEVQVLDDMPVVRIDNEPGAWGRNPLILKFRAKTWPRIPGLTVRHEDTTV